MGAVHGFRPDANGDGRISQKEFKAMKKLGLDVNYLDKDGNGKVDKDVKSKANCVFLVMKKEFMIKQILRARNLLLLLRLLLLTATVTSLRFQLMRLKFQLINYWVFINQQKKMNKQCKSFYINKTLKVLTLRVLVIN